MPSPHPELTPYFAYGSNLDPRREELVGVDVGAARRARLPGYRLAFNKKAWDGPGVYANIIAAPGEEVRGVIYACGPAAMAAFDAREGVASGHYRRERLTVFLDSGEAREVVTYVAGETHVVPEGRPAGEYLGQILHGARHHGLSAAYIRAVEDLALNGPRRRGAEAGEGKTS